MKWFVLSILLAAMFVAGCATPEDYFMSGTQPPAAAPKKSSPVETATNAMPVAPPASPAPVKSVAAPAASATPMPPIIVTPDNSLAGKVLAYNSPGHFVVLGFPAGPMPKMDQTLFLYRAGLKVAEVKITGPQRDSNTVADVVNGNAQAGDEVRDQ
jgi:hypothetical protein